MNRQLGETLILPKYCFSPKTKSILYIYGEKGRSLNRQYPGPSLLEIYMYSSMDYSKSSDLFRVMDDSNMKFTL